MHITVERPINTTIFPVDEQVASFRYFLFFFTAFYTRGAGFGHSRELFTGKSCKPISRKHKCFQKANEKSLLFNGKRDNTVLLF